MSRRANFIPIPINPSKKNVEPENTIYDENKVPDSTKQPEMIRSKFLNDGEWKIESNSDVTAALNALNDPVVGPATIVFAPQTTLSHNASLDDFIYVLKRKSCAMRIISPQFQSPSKPNEEMDSLCKFLFKEFKINNLKFRLEEYRSHLSSEEVGTLTPRSSLKTLGLSVATADDVQIVATLMKMLKSDSTNIKSLHLSLHRQLKPEDFDFLQGLCPATLHLHFYGLTDEDVQWMTCVTHALDKPFTRDHVCVDAIYLSQSQLTIKGVQGILRAFRQLNSKLQYPVFVEAPAVHRAAQRAVCEEQNSGAGPRLYFVKSPPLEGENVEKSPPLEGENVERSPLLEGENTLPPKLKPMERVHEFVLTPEDVGPLLCALIVVVTIVALAIYFIKGN